MLKYKIRKFSFDIFVFFLKRINKIFGKKYDITYYYSTWFALHKKIFRRKFYYKTKDYKIEYHPVNDGIGWPIFFTGAFEKFELECCNKFITIDSIVLDIGANIGLHTVHYANKAKNGLVYAFEPSKYTYEILQKNTLSLSNVITINLAISKMNAITEFYECENNALSGLKNTNRSPIKRLTKILTITGDDFCELYKIPKIDFIKIDVEGLEFEVIQGLTETIKSSKPVIFCEIFKGINSSEDPLTIINFLIGIGYKAYVLIGQDLKPFVAHNDNEHNYFFVFEN